MELRDVLERQCRLQYYMHMTLADQNELDASELDWSYQWLIKTKKEEIEQIENIHKGRQ